MQEDIYIVKPSFPSLGPEDLISTLRNIAGCSIPDSWHYSFFQLIKIFAWSYLSGVTERSLGPNAEKTVSKPKFTHFTIWGQFFFFFCSRNALLLECCSPMSLLRLPVPTTLSSTLLIPQSIRSSAKNWL